MKNRFYQADIAQRFRIFFEAQEVPYAMALLRITLPLVMLIGVLQRFMYVRELFSTDGSPTPIWETYGMKNFLPILPPAAAMALYAVLICCLITTCLGWKTRISLIVCLLLYPYFSLLDALTTLTKYSMVGTHLLLLLSVSECGSVWSVDAWLKNSGSNADNEPTRSAVWPRRLLQLFIGFVYLGAASTKFHTPAYFNGDQLTFWMLTNVNFPNPLGEYLSLYPALTLVFAYCTIIWEVLFLFIAWKGYTKWIMISIGLVFHVMTYLTLGLLIFPLMFACCYFAFLEEHESLRVGKWLQGVWQRTCGPLFDSYAPLPVKSFGNLTAFLMMLAVLATISVTTEAQMDVYGERNPQGRHQLQPLSTEEVQTLFRNDTSIHSQDNIFSMDMGTALAAGLLIDHRTSFNAQETAIVQCRLVRPHDDLWLEVNMHSADGQLLKRNGMVAPREQSTLNFELPLNLLTPGDYAFVLKVNGQDAHHRKFSVR